MENGNKKVTLKILKEELDALKQEMQVLKAENAELKEIILNVKNNKPQSHVQNAQDNNNADAAHKYTEVEIPKDVLTKLVLGIYKNSLKKEWTQRAWSQFPECDELSGKQIIPWKSLVYVVNCVYGKELSVAERGNIVETLINKGVIIRHVYADGRKAFVVSNTTMTYGQKVFGDNSAEDVQA